MASIEKSCTLLIFIDRTDVQQRDAAMWAAAAAAEAGNRAKSEFLAAMSHDLRTPLEVIRGLTELMLEDAGDAADTQRTADLEAIDSAGRRLLRLISDLLAVAKTATGRAELHIEVFDVEPLVREVAVAVAPVLEETRNRLTIDLANGIAPCATDRSKLRNVLVHLVTNLARLSADSAIRLTVLPRAAAGSRLQIRVVGDDLGGDTLDTGRLFETEVETTDQGLRKSASLLGITTSHRLCRSLGAT